MKKAGVGAVALASLPGLLNTFSTSARAEDEGDGGTEFHFLSFSGGPTIGGVQHRIVMSGDGTIGDDEVEGGGSFVHFDNLSAVPKTILGSGTWKAQRLRSFETIGSWGAFIAGILEMDVKLIRQIPSRAVISATLEQICNLGAAGLQTGEEEGFILTIPGAPFSPFEPLSPIIGITAFTSRD